MRGVWIQTELEDAIALKEKKEEERKAARQGVGSLLKKTEAKGPKPKQVSITYGDGE